MFLLLFIKFVAIYILEFKNKKDYIILIIC